MRVAELMVTDLTVINEDVTMAEAVLQLADAKVHGAPVVDRRGRIVGVLSSSDVLQATAEHTGAGDSEAMFSQMLVRDIMTTPPRTVRVDDEVRTAAQRMLDLDIHRLFVEEDGELLGVIAQSDIVRAVATGKL